MEHLNGNSLQDLIDSKFSEDDEVSDDEWDDIISEVLEVVPPGQGQLVELAVCNVAGQLDSGGLACAIQADLISQLHLMQNSISITFLSFILLLKQYTIFVSYILRYEKQ